jgi:hypothetical protein
MVLMAAVVLVLPGYSGPGGRAYAQGGSSGLTEQQRRQMEQKYQEDWETRERIQKKEEDTGGKLREAEKKRQDAQKRQREAERRSQEFK